MFNIFRDFPLDETKMETKSQMEFVLQVKLLKEAELIWGRDFLCEIVKRDMRIA